MFYTKYRPQKFSELSRPSSVAEALMTQVKTGKTAHAYLFVGSRGVGKTTVARILAKALNCENLEKDGDPCDKCTNCLSIKNGTFLDLIEIDAASNRGIDDIRDLRDKVKLAPSVGRKKVYIIDEVHMLTTEAFNALLKTLEEPPSHCVFILCTTESHKVPDTIKSRCQVFNIKRATLKQLMEKLGNIAEKEGAQVTKKNLEMVARSAFGGFRDAETTLQQIIEGNLDVNTFLTATSKEDYLEFMEDLLKSDAASALRKINLLYTEGVDLYTWTGELLEYFRELLFIKADAYEGLIDAPEEVLANMQTQAGTVDTTSLTHVIRVFLEAQNAIKTSPVPQLPLELAIVTLSGNNLGSKVSMLPVSGEPATPRAQADSIALTKHDDKKPIEEEGLAKVENASQQDTSSVEMAEIKEKWSAVLERVVKHNSSILALLKMANPVEIEANKVVLEVPFA
ncbi:MAG: DNA polymerase III subunit gamma/tau, partial [Patescibacteria group bacterium]